MMLNNMKNYLLNKALLANTYGTVTANRVQPIVACDGTVMTNFNRYSVAPMNTFYTSAVKTPNTYNKEDLTGICFGDGTDLVTAEDYKLSNVIESSIALANVSQKVTTEVINKSEIRKNVHVQFDVRNNNEYMVSINEIGFLNTVYVSSDTTKSCLVHRERLNQTVVIDPGSSATFTFDMSFTNSVTCQSAEEGEF